MAEQFCQFRRRFQPAQTESNLHSKTSRPLPAGGRRAITRPQQWAPASDKARWEAPKGGEGEGGQSEIMNGRSRLSPAGMERSEGGHVSGNRSQISRVELASYSTTVGRLGASLLRVQRAPPPLLVLCPQSNLCGRPQKKEAPVWARARPARRLAKRELARSSQARPQLPSSPATSELARSPPEALRAPAGRLSAR